MARKRLYKKRIARTPSRCEVCNREYYPLLCNKKRQRCCSRVCGHTIKSVFSPATEHPTTRDIAWAAGIYEGEGTARMGRTSTHVAVAQKDRWILEKLVRLFGGHIHVSRNHNGVGSNMHKWLITGPRARGFLMTIYTFLSPWRKEQALKALELSDAQPVPNQ